MIPIGGDILPNTMGVDDAVEAVKLIQPRLVIPVHFNSPFLWRKNVNPADDIFILGTMSSVLSALTSDF